MTNTTQAERSAVAVGLVTSVIGAALLAAPQQCGALLGVRDDTGLRALGAVDLIVASGLLTARPRWPWLAARALCNPPTALYLVLLARRFRVRAPAVGATVILAATVADARAVQALRAANQ